MAGQTEKTNVMRVLEQKNIPYTAHAYDQLAGTDGASVAKQLGQDLAQVFKTLVARGASGGLYVFDIPVGDSLDLKKAARAVGEKSVAMIAQKELLPLTGYVHGGCSPVGMKKAFPTMLLAFTSRSSVGCLPMTIETLTKKLGVNQGTASFVAGFGTTAGMQGCAGIFPSLLIIYVCNVTGTPIDVTMIIMTIFVVAIGSLGIAGIPGTATMAASVSLSGVGMGAQFAMISPILAVDPIIDMPRTMLNVTGSITNALVVDKHMGTLNEKDYNDMSLNQLETKK